ncbi:metalloprotease [Entomophthora muscae]|uniref:Metalloprotease n=1 Tax=Entomophthora muscae TaxID=34485 RepID=A0ACC2TVJ6_9FUNG|nr:metalloprotease [Entomophthora muscae]
MRIGYAWVVFVAACTEYEYKEHDGISYRKYMGAIRRSEGDMKSYRSVILDNQLEVLLVSDPLARKASASLVVSSGSQDDPDETLGLAHFCEHMMHMGSAKYPDEGTYSNYLNDNGGSFSATTYYNHTSYRFQINPDGLAGALDIFAHLFIQPNLAKHMAEKEIAAVQEEYEYSTQISAYKVQAVLLAALNITHPYSRFGMGNHKTLKPNKEDRLYEKVRLHYYRYYSANLMKLVVISSNHLDHLEHMTIPRFSLIPNFKLHPTNTPSPFRPDLLAVDIHMNPNMYTNQMIIQFIMPPLHQISQLMAFDYISYYLTRTDPDSFLDCQLKKGRMESIQAELSEQYSHFSIYTLTIKLTGQLTPDEITKDLFHYLQALKHFGITDERYAEFKAITASRLLMKPIDYEKLATKFAENMHHGIPIRDIALTHGFMDSMDASAIKEAIKLLSLFSMRRVIISPSIKAVNQEPWFKSNYSVYQLTHYLIANVSLIDRHANIPRAKIPKKMPAPRAPETISLVYNTPEARLWHVGGRSSSRLSTLSLAIVDPHSTMSTLEMVKFSLLSKLLKESFDKAQALSISEHVKFHYFTNKLVVQLQAFNIQASLGSILNTLAEIEINADSFSKAKHVMLKKQANFNTSSAATQTHYMAASAIQWDKNPINAFEAKLTILDLISFQVWVRSFLGCYKIAALLVGQADAQPIIREITKAQVDMSPCSRQFKYPGEITIPGEHIYRIPSNHKVNSAVTMYIDLYRNNDIQARAMAALNNNIIKSRFNNKLRTQEQLGYMINVTPLKRSGGGGLAFVLQSSKHPTHLELRIENFLEEFIKMVENMSPSSFTAIRQALLYDMQLNNPTLWEIQSLYWPTILNDELDFKKGNSYLTSASYPA